MRRASTSSDHSAAGTQLSTPVVRVRVTPRAGANALAGFADGVLRVRLAAPPVEGRANQALIRCLAQWAGLPPSRVRLLSGERGRVKRVAFDGIEPAVLCERLGIPADLPLA